MFLHELRYACRLWRRDPLVLALAVALLALGIGLNGAIYSVVKTVLLTRLPYRDAGRLVDIEYANRRMPNRHAGLTAAQTAELAHRSRTLAEAAAWDVRLMLLGGAGHPYQVHACQAGRTLFQLVGAQPLAGRFFSRNDVQHRRPVVILAERLWRSRFNADPRAIGRAVTLDGTPYTIIGIAPQRTRFPLLAYPARTDL